MKSKKRQRKKTAVAPGKIAPKKKRKSAAKSRAKKQPARPPVPRPPDSLGQVARAEWRRRIKADFAGDLNMLAGYCAAIERAADADAILDSIRTSRPATRGLMVMQGDKPIATPAIAIKESAERHALMLGKSLGFTPAAATPTLPDPAKIKHGELW